MASDQWRPKRVNGLGDGFGVGGLCVGTIISLLHEASMPSTPLSGELMAGEESVPGSVIRLGRHWSNTTRFGV